MSRLRIELDRGDATYQPGEEVTGNVVVQIEQRCRQVNLTAALGTRATPQGPVEFTGERRDRVEGTPVADKSEIFEAGENRRPFRFTPSGVLRSYAGALMRIQPVVRARWYPFETHEQVIHISPQRDRGLRVAWNPTELAPARFTYLAVAALVALVSSVAAAAIVVRGASGWLAIPLMFLVVSLFVVAVGVLPWLARRKTGPVMLELDRDPGGGDPQAGDRRLRVTLECRPDAPSTPPRAMFVVREFVRGGSGKDSSVSWEHDLYRQEVELRPGRREGGFQGTLPLPEAGSLPYPLLLSERTGERIGKPLYELQWKLELEIPIARWPNWRKEIFLRAHPVDVPFDD